MTTILADARLGLMVSDSNVSDGTTVSSMRKVWRIHGDLVGLSGRVCEFEPFLDWYRGWKLGPQPKLQTLTALVLSNDGLRQYVLGTVTPSQRGWEAIGSGSMAATAVYEALGKTDPAQAVRIVCRHDNGSRPPVRTYKLKQKAIE